jgi:UDP-N-acetylmuramoyl-L-alanyl-D-glutamate--2,6-diaminopimelate ligase
MSSVAFSARRDSEPVLNASHMTTLEAPEVQEHLAAMVDGGMRYAVIEASSHGLALHRVDECAFDVAVFTTLSRDHLDFHGTLDEYRDAKGRLFRMLDESPPKDVPRTAVLNADDPASEYFRSLTAAPAVTYGVDGLDEVVDGLATFPGVRGHLERVEAGQPFRVVVDIASTPEALRRVLQVLRPTTEGRLWAVFGCAGERDPARRDGMGRVAGELADFTVLTNEDPRREDPDAIIDAIAAGMRQAGRREERDFIRKLDRREAMRYAFERAEAGDTVLLAGKGTEQSIVIGRKHHSWDEARVARELLQELVGSKTERGC